MMDEKVKQVIKAARDLVAKPWAKYYVTEGGDLHELAKALDKLGK